MTTKPHFHATEAVAAAILSFIRNDEDFSVNSILAYMADRFPGTTFRKNTVSSYLSAFYDAYTDKGLEIDRDKDKNGRSYIYLADKDNFVDEKAETVATVISQWHKTATTNSNIVQKPKVAKKSNDTKEARAEISEGPITAKCETKYINGKLSIMLRLVINQQDGTVKKTIITEVKK